MSTLPHAVYVGGPRHGAKVPAELSGLGTIRVEAASLRGQRGELYPQYVEYHRQTWRAGDGTDSVLFVLSALSPSDADQMARAVAALPQ